MLPEEQSGRWQVTQGPSVSAQRKMRRHMGHGALAGAAAALAGDYYRRRWDRNEQAKKLIRQYRDPLLRAAFDLQSRLYNIIVRNFTAYIRSPDAANRSYAVDTTLWYFAHYLGWVEILRREVQFLDLGTARRNKELQTRLAAISGALASDRLEYEPRRARRKARRKTPASDPEQGEAARATAAPAPSKPSFVVFRADQRAIGEAMVTERQHPEETKRLDCLNYGEFMATGRPSLDDEPPGPFDRWLVRFRAELDTFASGEWDAQHPRLVEVQRGLVDLIDLLDPDQERFPNRDVRGKVPPVIHDDRPPHLLAQFMWPDDPWPTVAEWAERRKLTSRRNEQVPGSVIYERVRRVPLGVRLEARVTRTTKGNRAWVSIEGWSQLPGLLAPLRPLVVGDPASPSGLEPPKGQIPLEVRSFFFGNSHRLARKKANDLLERFGRPKVVPDRVPRRQWLIAAVPVLGVAGLMAGLATASAGSDGSRSGTSSTVGTDSTVSGTHSSPASTGGGIPSAPSTTTETGPGTTSTGTSTGMTSTTGTEAGPGTTPPAVPVATISFPACSRDQSRSQCRAHRTNVASWRILTGRVVASRTENRVRGVEVSIVRVTSDRCSAYTGFGFSRVPCAEAFGLWLPAAVDAGRWRMVVRRLTPGRYVVRARAVDTSSRQQRPAARALLFLR
jgi:hypothetical protein